MIEDIDSNIKKSVGLFGGLFGITRAVVAATGGSSSGNTALALIYDYNKCNDYAKVIMDVSGAEKDNKTINDYLTVFNEISIECGN